MYTINYINFCNDRKPKRNRDYLYRNQRIFKGFRI